jgi:hypothetical protein
VLQLHVARDWRVLTSGLASQVSSSSDSCWAKAARGKQLLQQLLAAAPEKGQSELEEGLFAMLRDDHRDTKPAAAHGYRLGDDRTGAAFETYRYGYGAGLLTQLARFEICGFLTIGLLGAGSGTRCGLRSQFSCLRRSSIERDALLSVRAVPGRVSAISVFLCKSVLYGAFVWAHRALNSQKRRFSVRAVLSDDTGFHYIERSHDDGSEPSHVPGTRRWFVPLRCGSAGDHQAVSPQLAQTKQSKALL